MFDKFKYSLVGCNNTKPYQKLPSGRKIFCINPYSISAKTRQESRGSVQDELGMNLGMIALEFRCL